MRKQSSRKEGSLAGTERALGSVSRLDHHTTSKGVNSQACSRAPTRAVHTVLYPSFPNAPQARPAANLGLQGDPVGMALWLASNTFLRSRGNPTGSPPATTGPEMNASLWLRPPPARHQLPRKCFGKQSPAKER